jgi:hypothetical protein
MQWAANKRCSKQERLASESLKYEKAPVIGTAFTSYNSSSLALPYLPVVKYALHAV